MAYTAADLEKLERAIADGRGARAMTFSDHSVTFGSIAEMRELHGWMKRQIESPTTYRLAVVTKGT